MLAPIDFSQLKVGDTLYQFEKITDSEIRLYPSTAHAQAAIGHSSRY